MSFPAKLGGTCSKCVPTYAKLADGAWGVRIPGASNPSGRIVVHLKNGTTKTETISRVIEVRDGAAICSIVETPKPTSSSRKRAGASYTQSAPPAPAQSLINESTLTALVAAMGSTLIGTETRSWTREGKDDVTVGEHTTWTGRDKSLRHGIVVSVEKSFYRSRRDCDDLEDMDVFDAEPGWYTPYTTREITEPVAVREAREKKESEAAAAKQAEADALAAHEAKLAAATVGMGCYGMEFAAWVAALGTEVGA